MIKIEAKAFHPDSVWYHVDTVETLADALVVGVRASHLRDVRAMCGETGRVWILEYIPDPDDDDYVIQRWQLDESTDNQGKLF